jgi:hypothetical protein
MTSMSGSGAGARALLLVSLAAVGAGAGCSFAFVKPPPPHIEVPRPIKRGHEPCTRLNIVPALDIGVASIAGGLVVISAIGTPSPDTTPEERAQLERTANITALVFLPIAALAAASAIYGFYETSKCQEYMLWAQLVAPSGLPVSAPASGMSTPRHSPGGQP